MKFWYPINSHKNRVGILTDFYDEYVDEVFELIPRKPIYLKDSLLKAAGISRDSFDLPSNCVPKNFNL